MPRTTLANIPSLPLTEWRAACLADTRKCDELLHHFGELKDYGDTPEDWSVPQLLSEAKYCLDFYENGGCAADECDSGNKQTLRERRQLRWFCTKWSKLLTQRQALIAAKNYTPPDPPAETTFDNF